MEKKGTRKQTAEAILKEVLGGGDLTELADSTARITDNGKAPSGGTVAASGAPTTGGSEDDVSPVYVASRSDLDRTFASMLPFFEGKETEHNWLNRESSIIKIRGMLATNAHEQFSSNFTAGIKSMQEGIVKTLVSLRTTLANHTIFLLAELARKVGDELDSSAEVFFSALLKMAGYTKKIVATGSQNSASEFITHLSFRHHFLYLISQGFLEKNQSIRIFMCDHLNTVLKVHGSKKHQVESHDGLQAIEISLKRGLNDPNPEVRFKSRDAFFKFEIIWSDSAHKIFEGLESNIKKQVNTARLALEKNGQEGAGSSSARPVASATPTTNASIVATRRPGGPSAAIMAAKRAASQKIAKEKKEREEEEEREREREAAFEEMNKRQENMALESALSASSHAQTLTPNAPTTSRRPRPVSVISPRSTLREASTVPLPGNSPSSHRSSVHQMAGSGSGLPVRSRTSSSGSHSTAGSQSGTPRQASTSSTTAASGASRAHLRNPTGTSTPSNIPRARTISSSSSTGSARSGGTTSANKLPNSGRRPPVSSSSHTNKAYQLQSPDSVAADDTLQFPTEDVSMDLMAFTSPLKGKGLMDQSMLSDLTFGNDNSLNADETATFHLPGGDQEGEAKIVQLAEDAKKAATELEDSLDQEDSGNRKTNEEVINPSTPKTASSGLPHTNEPNLGRSPNSQTQTPNSARRRSGLPRPVSMLHRGPSPLHHYSNEISSPSSSSTSKHTPGRSLDASNLLASSHHPQQTQRNPSGSSDVSTISHDGPLPTLSASSSMTSVAGPSFGAAAAHFDQPAPSRASNLWFLNKASRFDSPPDSRTISSPIKSKPESKEWIESLRDGTADLKVFRRLAKLSSEFKLPILNVSSAISADEMVLQPGRLNGKVNANGGGALGLQKMGEDELTRDVEDRAIDAWTEGNLFVRIFDGLNIFLENNDQSEDLKSAALVLLHRLVDHQYALFVSSSRESGLLSLLIRLNKASTRSKLIQKGCDTILDAWSFRSNPILGFGRMVDCLRDGLEGLPSRSPSSDGTAKRETESMRVKAFSLGLRGLGNLLSRLPEELVEEELPRASDLIRTAFNDANADLRQMAVVTICSAHKQLNDPRKLFELIGPLDQQQENLLTYYFAKPLRA